MSSDRKKYSPLSTTTTTTTTTTAAAASADMDDDSSMPTKGSKAQPQAPLDYVLMSIPAKSAEELDEVWNQHVDIITKEKIGRSARLEIPDFPVGTFDSLMTLSDDLGRIDTIAESLCHKIITTLTDLYANTKSSSIPVWKVNEISPSAYMARFTWDEKKYPHKAPLRDTVGRIQSNIQRFDTELRTHSSRYTTAERAAAADSRKESGSLVTRSLADVVKPADVINTEYLTTVFVVVPKSAEKDFLNKYEKITDFVLPRSAKVIIEDSENKLFTVTVFKRTEDDLKSRLRDMHLVIRDVDLGSLTQESREDTERRANEKKKLENKLTRWSFVHFGEAFSAWMHIKVIRIFVESVLRYGLPPCFVAPVLCPAGKSHDLKKTLAQLAKVYQPLIVSSQSSLFGNTGKDDDSDSINIGMGGHQEKLLPFVYSLLHLDLAPQTN